MRTKLVIVCWLVIIGGLSFAWFQYGCHWQPKTPFRSAEVPTEAQTAEVPAVEAGMSNNTVLQFGVESVRFEEHKGQ